MLTPAVVVRVLENGTATPNWWDLSLLFAFVICMAALASILRSRRNPRGSALAIAMVTGLGIATFPLVAGSPLSPGEMPWVALLVPIAGGALGVAFHPVPAVASAVALSGLNAFAHRSGMWPESGVQQLDEAIYLVVCTLVAATGMEALRIQANAIDLAEQRAISAAALEGEMAARSRESARWDAFIHDEVLATLEAARVGTAAPEEVRQLASDAVAGIHQPIGGERPLVDELWAALLNKAERICGVVRATVRNQSGSIEIVPEEVSEAIASAVTEACRNVRRHAPVGTHVSLAMTSSPSGVKAEVSDDGGGFELSRVPRSCMGIGVSIIGRMRAVGGDASVVSANGSTAVSVWWPGPSP